MTLVLAMLLNQLKTQWIRLGAPIARALRPGLSDGQLDVVAQRLGLELPREVRELWAWHDGADPTSPRDIGPGGYEFLTTDEVVSTYEANLSRHAESPDPHVVPDMYWHRSWIPLMVQGAQRLYVDARRATTTGVSPVRLVSWEWEDFTVDRAPSLAAAVSMWTWLLESDYYRWDGNDLGEPVDYATIPVFARLTMA